jgi:hypothetical protein
MVYDNFNKLTRNFFQKNRSQTNTTIFFEPENCQIKQDYICELSDNLNDKQKNLTEIEIIQELTRDIFFNSEIKKTVLVSKNDSINEVDLNVYRDQFTSELLTNKMIEIPPIEIEECDQI